MNLAMALRGALVMIFVGTGLGLAQNALSPDPLPWKPVPKTTLDLDQIPIGDPTPRVGDVENPAAVSETPASPSGSDDASSSRSDEPPATAIDEAPPSTPTGEQDPAPVPDETADAPTEPDPVPDETADAATEPDPVPDETADAAMEPDAVPDETPGEDPYADIPDAQFPYEVSLERAKSLYDRGGLLVLDAREHHEFVEGHIAGAESAPFDVMVGEIEWLDRTAADPRPLLVYCDGTDCEISLNLGFEISQAGHGRVLILQGGYRGWADAGHPTATGEQP